MRVWYNRGNTAVELYDFTVEHGKDVLGWVDKNRHLCYQQEEGVDSVCPNGA